MSKRKYVDVVNIKLPKRPMRQFHEVTFDRKKIRESIKLLTYNEAARLNGNMYEALQNEMFREGCRRLREFLECVSQKEQKLVTDQHKRDRITDPEHRSLFYKVIDKLKNGELEARKTKVFAYKRYFLGYLEAYELLEPHEDKLEYFIRALMETTIKQCNNLEGQENDAAEVITRIFCKYVEYLQKIGDTPGAIKYLERALALARSHSWLVTENHKNKIGKTIHEFVGETLANLLLKYSKHIYLKIPKQAIALAQRAIFVATEIGREKHMALYCNSYLTQAEIFIENENYICAKRALDKIKPEVIKRPDLYFSPTNIKFYLYQGRVEKYCGNINKGIASLQEALKLSSTYEQHFLEGQVLLSIGKVYATDREKYSIAKKYFEKAKCIFINSNDRLNLSKSIYLLASLKADALMPKYKRLIDHTNTGFCALYKLRQWKNCLSPFWSHGHKSKENEKAEPILCLLEEENSSEKK